MLVKFMMGLMVGEMSTLQSKRANSLAGREWLQNSFSIWRGFHKNHEERKIKHPAMFPVSLIKQILETFTTLESVTVLDPFAGSGSTLLAAKICGVNAVGTDVNPEYRELYLQRTVAYNASSESSQTYILHDARKVSDIVAPNSIDICITSPPYWDILNARRTADVRKSVPYSDSKFDLGNLSDYSVFTSNLAAIMSEVHICLKNQSYFILNVMDIRKGSRFYPFHIDAIRDASEIGFELNDIIIWDRQQDYNSMRPLGYPYKFIVNKVHEYLLIMRKVQSHAT